MPLHVHSAVTTAITCSGSAPWRTAKRLPEVGTCFYTDASDSLL